MFGRASSASVPDFGAIDLTSLKSIHAPRQPPRGLCCARAGRVVPLDVLGLSLAEAMARILLIPAGSLLMTSSRSDARMAADEYVATGR